MNSKEKQKIAGYWKNFFKNPENKTDLEDVIAAMPPFMDLSPKYLKLLMKIIHYRTYSTNENIFCEGDPGVGLFIVKEGSVKIVLDIDNEDQRVIANFERGDFFGDMALLEETPRSATAVALEETNLAVIFKPDLDEFIDRYPIQGVKILRGLSQIIASRLRILNKDYTELFNIAYQQNGEQENENNQKNSSTD